ncbi:MAG: hypothetical protein KOO65_13795 [Desulfobacterales bacterium]|nr:hypothetical protein [Desulfobacterales bacterium]
MRKTKSIEINGKDYICKELTPGQVKEVLDEIEKANVHILDLLFPESVPCFAVQLSTGKTKKELEELPPSAYEVLLKAVEEVNPFFVALVKRMLAAANKILAQKK